MIRSWTTLNIGLYYQWFREFNESRSLIIDMIEDEFNILQLIKEGFNQDEKIEKVWFCLVVSRKIVPSNQSL